MFFKILLFINLLYLSSYSNDVSAVVNLTNLKNTKRLGIVESLNGLINLDKTKIKRLNDAYKKDKFFLDANDSNIKDIFIMDDFLRSMILFSKKKFLSFANNKCKMMSLLENNLLKLSTGIPKNIIIHIFYKNNTSQTKMVSIKNLIEYTYKTQCQNYLDYKKLFTNKNLIQTINSFDITVPKSQKQCLKKIKTWQNNNFLPYICNLNKKIKKYNLLTTLKKLSPNLINNKNKKKKKLTIYNNINFKQKMFFSNLCSYIYSPQHFCSIYNNNLIWQDLLENKKKEYKIIFRCRRILHKANINLSGQDLKRCIDIMTKNINICSIKQDYNLLAFYPGPRCNQLSETLKFSNLKTFYHDCPGEFKNLSLVNIYRLIKHFNFYKNKSSQTATVPMKNTNNNLSCKADVYENLYKFFKESHLDKRLWPYKLCFNDLILEKNVCLNYIPNTNASAISEKNIFGYILSRTKGASVDTKCTILKHNEYNPNFLLYKNGCFINIDINKNCSEEECNKTVIFNNKKFTKFTRKTNENLNYFNLSYKDKNISLEEMLIKNKHLKAKNIVNFSLLKIALNKKSTVINGIGCLEILLPNAKKTSSFNQCTPIPFIIDGYKRKSFILSIHLANTDIQWPLSINWGVVYNAVLTYSQLSPTKKWSLHALSL